MASGGNSNDQAKKRMDEVTRIRTRVRTVGPSGWPVYGPPVLFFLVSFLLSELDDQNDVSPVLRWSLFAACGAVALLVTLLVLGRRPLIRRAHRLTAPSLVIYLLAAYVCLEVRDKWGTNGFLAVLLVSMLGLVVLSNRVRRDSKPKDGVLFSDQTEAASLRPVIIALFESDRVDKKLLAEICETKGGGINSALEKLSKAGYVNLGTRAEGQIDTVFPTSYLRQAARRYEQATQRAASGRPQWLRNKASK